jgi:hypothetical protein
VQAHEEVAPPAVGERQRSTTEGYGYIILGWTHLVRTFRQHALSRVNAIEPILGTQGSFCGGNAEQHTQSREHQPTRGNPASHRSIERGK